MELDVALYYAEGVRRPGAEGEAEEAVLTLADEVERVHKLARDYVAAHPYPGRDEFERGSIVAMQIVLGEPLGRAS